MNSVWARTLAALVAAALAGLVVWPLAGAAWAWAVLALALGFIVLRHAANLAALADWLRRPTLRALPEGSGIWEDVLAALHGFLKRRDIEHADALRMLGRFHDAARALPDGVILLDAESRIVWANPTAQWHFGIDVRRDAGQPVAHLVRHPDFVAYLERGEFDAPLAARTGRRTECALSRARPAGSRAGTRRSGPQPRVAPRCSRCRGSSSGDRPRS